LDSKQYQRWWHGTDGTINWTVNLGTGTKTVTYQVTAPASPSESATFGGTIGGIEIKGTDSLFYIYPKLWDTRIEAPSLNNTVTLDGLIDAAEYAGANEYYFDHDTSDGNEAPGVHISGTEYTAAESNMTFHIFHDATYLYIACDVTDSNMAFNEDAERAWHNDSVEIFMDGNLGRTTDREDGPYGFQLTIVGDGHLVGGNDRPTAVEGDGFYSSTDGSYWNYGARVKEDGTGYVVEYKIDKTKTLLPVDRTIAGFEILMNGSEQGAGERTYKWGYYSSREDGTIFEAHQR
jgi:hypothetical protein